jgi:zinc/manganese transport system permease protein
MRFHVGFAGAPTGAVGAPPLAGAIALTLAAGIGMGLLAERISGRDVAIGIVLAVAPGFGLLPQPQQVDLAPGNGDPLGNVLAVSPAMLVTLAILGTATLAAMGFIARPLLFATLQPELADARGLSPRLVGVIFLGVAALAVAQSVQIVGVLLVFALMVGPPAAAQLITARIVPGLVLSALLAAGQAWLGIVIAWYTDWPTALRRRRVGLVYFGALEYKRRW